jgi:hypothetical protein
MITTTPQEVIDYKDYLVASGVLHQDYQSSKLVCVNNQPDYPEDKYFRDSNKLEVGKVYDGFLVYVYGDGSSGCSGIPNGSNTQPCGWFIDGVSRSVNENYPFEFFESIRDSNLDQLLAI